MTPVLPDRIVLVVFLLLLVVYLEYLELAAISSIELQRDVPISVSTTKQRPDEMPLAPTNFMPQPEQEITKITPAIQTLLDQRSINVKAETMRELTPHTFQFSQRMKIESQATQSQCINEETRSFNRSEEFNCSIFQEDNTKRGLEKMRRNIYFDKLCSPQVTVNTLDGTVETQTFTRCSYFEYSNRTDGSPQYEWVCMLSYVQISAPKTGTTSMFRTMTANPFINRYYHKEPNFLNVEERNSAPTGSDPIDYLQEMCAIEKLVPNEAERAAAIEEAAKTNSIPTICSPIICGDHSTQYAMLGVRNTLQNIKRINPDTKFLSFLREPISRTESDANFFCGGRITTPEEYETHLDNQLSTAKMNVVEAFDNPIIRQKSEEEAAFPYNDTALCKQAETELNNLLVTLSLTYGTPLRSFYWLYLEAFLEEYSRSDIFIAFTENLKDDQQQNSLNNIFSFLGVPAYTATDEDLDGKWANIKDHAFYLNERTVQTIKEIMIPHNQKVAQLLSLAPNDFPRAWQYTFDLEF